MMVSFWDDRRKEWVQKFSAGVETAEEIAKMLADGGVRVQLVPLPKKRSNLEQTVINAEEQDDDVLH